MTPDNEQFFNAAQDTFGTDGWKNFMMDIQAVAAQLVNLDTLESAEDLWKAKGKLEALRYVASYETLVAQMATEDEDDADT